MHVLLEITYALCSLKEDGWSSNDEVHDHLVSYDVCIEAVERGLLEPEPLLKRVVESSG